MPGGEEVLLTPVLAGLCKYESLMDGTLDLADVMLLNDALAVKADNEFLAQEQMERRKNG